MLSKDIKNKRNHSLPEQFLLAFVNFSKHNQVLMIFGILTWSLFLPITLYSLGFSPYHIIYNGFRIV